MTDKPASAFRKLHQPGNPFILANAWDAGSAKVLAALGAKAIATTSAGHAFVLGTRDMGHITRDQSLDHARELIAATPLPVSGDFENGYGREPETVAETVRLAAQAGLAGCSIEDTDLPDAAPYDFAFAVERIEAAVAACKDLPEDFVLCARADGMLTGTYDTDEAIRRLQAFEKAGADLLYAPMPPSMDDLARICSAVDAPVNALAAGRFVNYSLAQFADIGVARVSLGSALARVTHAAIINAAGPMLEAGDFIGLKAGVGGGKVDALLDAGGRG